MTPEIRNEQTGGKQRQVDDIPRPGRLRPLQQFGGTLQGGDKNLLGAGIVGLYAICLIPQSVRSVAPMANPPEQGCASDTYFRSGKIDRMPCLPSVSARNALKVILV